ncbi:MAG: DNA adenine methylase [Flavobacteriales bacterium]|nr:DNA adenine methylase [Flavobacteriales bacterium]
MKPQATLFNAISCAYCFTEYTGKPGEKFPGFFDADTQQNVCSKCADFHYFEKGGAIIGQPTKHKVSEVPLIYGLAAFGTDRPAIQEAAATSDFPKTGIFTVADLTPEKLLGHPGIDKKLTVTGIDKNGICTTTSKKTRTIHESRLVQWLNEPIPEAAATSGHTPAAVEPKTTTNKAPRPYPGNKGTDGTYHRIINHFPPHHTYIELFAGSAQILQKKKPAEFNYAIERSPEVISTYAGQWPADTTILNHCAIDWLKTTLNLLGKGNLIYLDPPYPMDSRKGQRDLYTHELSDDDHRELLRQLRKAKSGVMIAISSYANPIYDEMLKDWNRYDFEVQTRGGSAIESLYMNYPEPTELHQYDLLGTDRTERQRIKRKVNRWADGLKRLPPLERNAILETLKTELL